MVCEGVDLWNSLHEHRSLAVGTATSFAVHVAIIAFLIKKKKLNIRHKNEGTPLRNSGVSSATPEDTTSPQTITYSKAIK